MKFDIIVIGGGPAGSMAALTLASKGAKVVMIEKEDFPRYKPCGGGLTAKAMELVNELEPDSTLTEKTISAITFCYRYQDPVLARLDKPLITMVMRDRFDAWLASKAVERGAQVFFGCEVTGINTSSGEVSSSGGNFHAPVIIAADGAHSTARRILGGHFPRGVALESEIPRTDEFVSRYMDRVYIDHGSIPQGYGWLFPKKDFLSVGIGSYHKSPSKLLSLFKEHLSQLKINSAGTIFTAHPLPYPKQTKLLDQKLLLAGDAAGLADPFTGEGIYYALLSGRLAGQAAWEHLEQGTKLENYATRVEKDLLKELVTAQRLGWVFYGFPGRVHQLIKKHPWVLTELLRVMIGETTYSDLWDKLTTRIALFKLMKNSSRLH